MKQVAIAIENPNNLKELNKYLEDGYNVNDSYVVKGATVFILRKYLPESSSLTRGVSSGSPELLGGLNIIETNGSY